MIETIRLSVLPSICLSVYSSVYLSLTSVKGKSLVWKIVDQVHAWIPI